MNQAAAVEAFKQSMVGHDWSYMFSDDRSVYRKGQAQADRINEQYRKMVAAGMKAQADEMMKSANNRKRY